MRLIYFIIVVLLVNNSYANTSATEDRIIELSTLDNQRVAITGPALSIRFGNAVMIKAFYTSSDDTTVLGGSFLATCDGKWISRRISAGLIKKKSDEWNPVRWESVFRDKWEDEGDVIEMIPWSHSQQVIASPLKEHLTKICEGAIPEIPNRLLTAESMPVDKNQKYRFYSIVSGTVAKNNGVIDIWERTTEMRFYKKDAPSKRTGDFTLYRASYDCKNNKVGATDFNVYKANALLSKRQSTGANVVMRDAIPGTIAFSTLQLACKLYGD